MNERIKELAKQARHQTEKGTLFEHGLLEYSENLANLIVKECATLIRAKDYSHTADPIFEASCDITDHFGISK
jgi:hypothetical protein